jgi:hypothetical protein
VQFVAPGIGHKISRTAMKMLSSELLKRKIFAMPLVGLEAFGGKCSSSELRQDIRSLKCHSLSTMSSVKQLSHPSVIDFDCESGCTTLVSGV